MRVTRQVGRDVLAGLTTAGIIAFVYRPALGLWWTLDDAFHLHFLTEHPYAAYFQPTVWRTLPFRMFTPLLFVSLEVDLVAFGFSPWHFYVHQLIGLVLAGVATYAVFRLWFPVWVALIGSLVVILGVPVASMGQQLMLRHYIEGWLLAALATLSYVVGIRRDKWWLAWVSALLYLCSALAKEIFAPLILILAILPEGSWGKRARRLSGHAVALIAYAVCRWLMLGTLGGGYGWNTYASELPVVLGSLPGKLAQAMFPGAAGLLLSIIVVGGMVPVLASPHAVRVIVALVVSIVPIVPVAKSVEPRYAFALWLTLIGTSLAGYVSLRRRVPLSALALSAALLATTIVHRSIWSTTFTVAQRMSVEGRSFMNLHEKDAVRNPAIPPAAMGELLWMKTVVFTKPSTGWFYDDIFLCTPRPSVQRVFEYNVRAQRLLDVTSELAEWKKGACGASIKPLYADFHYDNGVLAWDFGPYVDGTYRVIIADGVQAFTVPRRDSFQLRDAPGLVVRVRYDSPEGWRTYSDVITLDFIRRPRERWERRTG